MSGKLAVPADAQVIDAQGAALLPGLNDHHIHLASLAASRNSLHCGPPSVDTEVKLTTALQRRSMTLEEGAWIRGIGYHESVAGDLDAAWLDARLPHVPVRIQHRGGRLWVFNSKAMSLLRVTGDDPFERVKGRLTGRLYEGDIWLKERMKALGQATPPDLSLVSRELASYGITGLTDTTPTNNRATLHWFQTAQKRGELLQTVQLMGDASLDGVVSIFPGITVGAHKFHLLESDLPDLEMVIDMVRKTHSSGRNVAFHCVTRTELVFALTIFQEAGSLVGDRIEHASVTPPEWLERIWEMGLAVVTQPGFIYERGDQYLKDVDADDLPWLYRLKGIVDKGIRLAGSSDAPFSGPNPWIAMQAAVERKTIGGEQVGPDECLSPEQALQLFTSPILTPGVPGHELRVGQAADLCLLANNWQLTKKNLAQTRVVVTIRLGGVIWRQ